MPCVPWDGPVVEPFFAIYRKTSIPGQTPNRLRGFAPAGGVAATMAHAALCDSAPGRDRADTSNENSRL
jgi:hypothetical protein